MSDHPPSPAPDAADQLAKSIFIIIAVGTAAFVGAVIVFVL